MFIDKFIKADPSVKRHVAKTITWRVLGTIDTMLLGWFISGNPMTGAKIGGLEVVTKMFLYFAHERIWFKSRYGLPKKTDLVKMNDAGSENIVMLKGTKEIFEPVVKKETNEL